MKKKKNGYKKELPRLMYTFFTTFSEAHGAPSFSKFARSIGRTLEDIEAFRANKEFERAYRECCEIRRDYLTDNALSKRFDSSFTKFVLTEEFGAKDGEEGGELAVTLKVLSDD